MKGVILAGGTGKRLGELTKATNKHLLPLGKQPMISHAIATMVETGIKEITVVTTKEHLFDFMHLIGDGEEFEASVSLCWQDAPRGIAHGLSLTRDWVDGDRVALMLGDNYYNECLARVVQNFEAQSCGARVLLYNALPFHDDVPSKLLEQTGVVEFKLDTEDPVWPIKQIHEKNPEAANSAFVVTGFYCYDERVFDIIDTLEPSARGELEITDVNNYYAERGMLEWDSVSDFWADAGTSIEDYYRVCDYVRGLSVRGRHAQ